MDKKYVGLIFLDWASVLTVGGYSEKGFEATVFFEDLCIYFREREHTQRGGSEGEGERILSRLRAECGVQCGTRYRDPEITTQGKTKS